MPQFCNVQPYCEPVQKDNNSSLYIHHLLFSILLRVAQEYRKERWWALLTSVLTTAIKCAYLLADVQDYIKLCIELMAEQINRSIETKTRIQADLLQSVSVRPVLAIQIFSLVITLA